MEKGSDDNPETMSCWWGETLPNQSMKKKLKWPLVLLQMWNFIDKGNNFLNKICNICKLCRPAQDNRDIGVQVTSWG